MTIDVKKQTMIWDVHIADRQRPIRQSAGSLSNQELIALAEDK